MSSKPDLNELLKHEKPIYVLNNTKPRGNIVLTCMASGGKQSKVLEIPPTRFPMRVDDQVPHAILKDSMDFRDYLRKRILVLVHETEALKRLEHPDAAKEFALINKSKFADDDNVSKFVNNDSADSGITDEYEDEIKFQKTVTVYPRALGVVNEVNTGDLPVTDAMIELKSIASLLEKKDFNYIIAKCEKKRIVDWAKKKITGGTKKKKKTTTR